MDRLKQFCDQGLEKLHLFYEGSRAPELLEKGVCPLHKMAIRTIVSILIFLLGLSSGLFLGQDFQLRTKVDLVVDSVSVRDGNGSLVPNLKQEDFTALEDSAGLRLHQRIDRNKAEGAENRHKK